MAKYKYKRKLQNEQDYRKRVSLIKIFGADFEYYIPAYRRPYAWAEEETALVEAFDEGESVARIAKVHGRSRGAIEARLVALGKMTNSFVFKRR